MYKNTPGVILYIGMGEKGKSSSTAARQHGSTAAQPNPLKELYAGGTLR